MKLSIIVPIYNVEDYLDECVSSLFNQGLDKDDFEVLLIDDGSSDSSLSIALRWSKLYANIRVFEQENQGQAVARNLGLEHAEGDYIMFVDSDDFLLPEKLRKLLVLAYEQNTDALIYNILAQRQDGTEYTRRIPNVIYNHLYTGVEVALKYDVFGSMCRGIFSRAVFDNDKLRFSSGFTHEDSELCFRLYPLLKKVIFIDEEVYFYRYNKNSTDRAKKIESLRKNIESDAVLVSKVVKDLESLSFSKNIKEKYREITNSMMIGFFLKVKDYSIWNKAEFDSKIKWLKDIGSYPIKGPTCSWRSYLLSKLYNRKLFLKILLYGWHKAFFTK